MKDKNELKPGCWRASKCRWSDGWSIYGWSADYTFFSLFFFIFCFCFSSLLLSSGSSSSSQTTGQLTRNARWLIERVREIDQRSVGTGRCNNTRRRRERCLCAVRACLPFGMFGQRKWERDGCNIRIFIYMQWLEINNAMRNKRFTCVLANIATAAHTHQDTRSECEEERERERRCWYLFYFVFFTVVSLILHAGFCEWEAAHTHMYTTHRRGAYWMRDACALHTWEFFATNLFA